MKLKTSTLVISIFLNLFLQAARAQPKAELSEAETERVFSNLGPAVQILGHDYERRHVDAQMRRYNVPGLGVALIENNEIRWVRYFGVRDMNGTARIDGSTRFMVKSLSKPVTAFAALRLVETGTFSLDDPVQQYLRQWQVPENEYTNEQKPTLRLILSHSAGFTVGGVPSYLEGEPLPTLLQSLDGVPPAKPSRVTIAYIPGTRSRYSGGGYSVLQLMIEEATGMPFPRAMRGLVLDSLKMQNSLFYSGVPRDLQQVTAVGHDSDGNPIEGRWERIVQMAAGALLSTPADMARFVIGLNSAYQGDSELLTREMTRAMMTPNAAGWGLGVEVFGEGARIGYMHTGSGDGFKAAMVGFPEIRKGAVIVANSDGAGELRYEILRSLADEYVWPAFRVIQRPTIRLEAERLRRYEGTYEYSDGSETTISFDTTALSAQWGDRDPVAIYPANDSLFFTLSNEEYVFSVGEGNLPAAVTWRGSFGEFRGDRRK